MPVLLSKGDNLNKFVLMLDACETHARRSNQFDDWERSFIESMREKFNSREDAFDFGLTPWSPTSNQWNTLKNLSEKI